MRAKVKITGIEAHKDEEGKAFQEDISFAFPSRDGGYPLDGSDEDQQFARWTPSARLEMTITNPSLIGTMTPGDSFYLDFTPTK